MATTHPRKTRKASSSFQFWVRDRVARRGAFPTLTLTTLFLAVGCGVVANAIANDDFSSYGDSIWWSLATLTTVGYGDVVPKSGIGRSLGVGVMVLGVTFLSFLTATVTSLFVSADEEERAEQRQQDFDRLMAAAEALDERLGRIEARLNAQ